MHQCAALSSEISEDDDSFEEPNGSKPSECSKNVAPNTVSLISSDSDETISYSDFENAEPVNISNEDSPLPIVNVAKTNPNVEKKNAIIRNLFTTKKEKQKTSKLNVPFNDFDKQIPGKLPVIPPKVEAPVYKKMIGGVEVIFPVPPYGCQIALTSKVSSIIE